MIILEFRERSSRAALFDGIEEGGIRASSSYDSREIDEQENEGAIDGLQDRVNMLKRVSFAYLKALSFFSQHLSFYMINVSLYGQCLWVKLQYRTSSVVLTEVYTLGHGCQGLIEASMVQNLGSQLFEMR